MGGKEGTAGIRMGIREMRREKQARRMIRKDKVLSVQESNWLIMQMRLYGERRNRYVVLWLCFLYLQRCHSTFILF